MAPDDTQPYQPYRDQEPPWLVNREKDEPVDLGFDIRQVDATIEGLREGRVPEPALVRGVIAAVVGAVGFAVGKQIDAVWIDLVMDVYVVAAPLALAWWIRRHVTPVKK